MAQSYLGTGWLEQPKKDKIEAGTGRTVVREWHGPRETYEDKLAEIVALQPDLLDGIRGTPGKITATFSPEASEDSAIWELLPTPMDRPLATHPTFNTSDYSRWTEEIDAAIRKGDGHKRDWNTESSYPNADDYYNLKSKGTDKWRNWSWVIRKSLTTSQESFVQADQEFVGRVVGYNEIGIPSTVKWSQPRFERWNGTTLEPVYINEWLTQPPTVRYEKRKYTIVKEWLGAVKWYKILYYGGTALTTEDGNNVG